ncbi:MAG: hypothetical protein ABIK65_07220 [Candidatus Eisenbacteria bacterium]
MTRRNRTILWIAVAVLAAVSLTGAAIATSIAGRGMIEVEVREACGTDVRFSVPVSFLLLALPFMPSEAYEGMPPEAVRYMGAVRIVGDELEKMPDFTMVEVESPGHRVLVRKLGKRLVVDVDDGGDVVHVSIPIGAVERVAKRIEKGRFFL